MINIEGEQSLSFGMHKPVSRKINIINLRKHNKDNTLKSASKSKKQKQRQSDSSKEKTTLVHQRPSKAKNQDKSQEKRADIINFSQKLMQHIKNPKGSNFSLQNKNNQHSRSKSSKKTSLCFQKSVTKSHSQTLLTKLDVKVHPFNVNRRQAILQVYNQLKLKHKDEEARMKVVLSETQLYRYRKILAVEELQYLIKMLSIKDLAQQ